MFGKRVADSASIVVTVKIAIGKGRPVIAWSGTAAAREADIVAEVSANPSVRRYLDRQVKAGRLKPDESGTLTVPAYLIISDEENNTVDEYKIELTLFREDVMDDIAKDDALRVIFEAYSQGMSNLNQFANKGVHTVAATAMGTLNTVAASVPTIIEKSAGIAERQLQIIKETVEAERLRANEATDAVLRCVETDKQKADNSAIEDVVKTLIAAPAALEAIKKLVDFLSNLKPPG